VHNQAVDRSEADRLSPDSTGILEPVVVAVLMTSPISQGALPVVASQTGSLHASVVRAELAIANLENSARLTVSVSSARANTS
jgi:hypothetical protein